jgi:hypothetical protein
MLRSFLRLLSKAPQEPSLVEIDANRVTLYAKVERPSRTKVVSLPIKTNPNQVSANPSHRERLLSMRLEHTRLCSTRRCQRFQELGVVTAGDLACATPERLAVHFRASRKAERVIKHYRRAIRFAAAVPGMMPRDAMLLISIHRRSVRGLALESPAALHRDLQRFAESTKGRVQLRGRQVPSTRRLKRWIAQCESNAVRSPFQARAA